MGFSAGGHLAASASVLFTDSITRPDFSVLIYPVIDLAHHEGTRKELVGDDNMLKEKYSLQNQIGEDTPRTFIALCQDDKVVNPKSSLLYYNSLLDKGIKAEMYISRPAARMGIPQRGNLRTQGRSGRLQEYIRRMSRKIPRRGKEIICNTYYFDYFGKITYES